MQSERRQVTRYAFTAPTEVTDPKSSQTLSTLSGDLSPFGCFLLTPTSFPQGTRIRVTISHADATFTAFGRVAYISDEGMGIVFSTVEPEELAILEEWLRQKSNDGTKP